jgi:rubrerythrin
MKIKAILLATLLIAVASLVAAADKPTEATTVDNLKAAFTGESTASAKYLAYGKKAREEGYTKIATLFEAASKSESFHAGNHKAVLEQLGEKAPVVEPKFEVKTTLENLQDAFKGESYEVATMYPEMLKQAAKENSNLALISFNYAYKTEINHKELYGRAIEALKAGAEKDLPSQYLVCSTCGNTYAGTAPARCGICMTSQDRFLTFAA